MKRGVDIPTEVGNLLSAAERYDAAAIVYDREDRVVVCNQHYRNMYRYFDYSPKQTYESLSIHVASIGLLDDPIIKRDLGEWMSTAVNFRRKYKLAQYLVHHSSGKTLLAHHQIFEGFGSIALRFDITNGLRAWKNPHGFNLTGLDLSTGKWSFSPICKNPEVPTAMLSRTCNLINANEQFWRILERKDGINIMNGRVYCEIKNEDALFYDAVLEKSFPGASGSKFIRISRKLTRGYYIISVFPMSPEASEYNPSMHGVSLVSILDLAQDIKINPKPLTKLFKLTATEAKIAALMGEGKDIYEISMENRTSIGTIRNQLKSIFLKVGVTRQSELVRVIHRMRQIDPVLVPT